MTKLISADSHVAVSLDAIRQRVPRSLHEAFDDATLFYDGFIIGRQGHLAWGGTREVWWILVLLGGALCGWALGRVRHHG